MIRDLSLDQLQKETVCCEAIESHRQIWKTKNAWLGNLNIPRAQDGLIIICSDIRATFTDLRGHSIVASRGDVVYIPQGSLYTVDFQNGGADPDMFTVNFLLRDGNGTPLRLAQSPQILLSNVSPHCRYIAAELRLLCLDPLGNRLQRQARLLELLGALTGSALFGSAEHAPIHKGVKLLISEWDQNEPMARYAQACRISESSFYQHFKDWAGVSPNEYRTGMRISAAKSMLRNSALSVQEIALQIGFADPYYFSRCFRRLVGIPPQAYRENKFNKKNEST